jgi:predicted O-linked N-acetylglucosamine transferase (SPINDLY family)
MAANKILQAKENTEMSKPPKKKPHRSRQGHSTKPVSPIPQTLTISQALQLATQNHQSGELQRAEVLYRQILQTDPKNSEVLQRLGIMAGQVNNYEAAVKLFNQAISIDNSDPTAYYNLGIALLAQNKLEEAIESLQRALVLNPTYLNANNSLCLAFKQLGKLDQAAACLQQMFLLYPHDTDVPYNLGNVFKEQGKLEEAVACYQQALTLNPDFSEANNNLANVLKMQGQLEAAVTYYQRALAGNPHNVQILSNLGGVFNGLNQFEEAATCFQRALSVTPHNAEVHKDLGIVFYNQGKYLEAVNCYQQALRLNPNDAEVYRNLGMVFYLQSRFTEAMDCYQRALALNPSEVETYRNLGILLYELGYYHEAIDFYQRALIIDSKQVRTHNNLGSALMKLGHLTEAVACFQQALSLNPNDAGVYNNLGLTCRDMGRLAEAIEHFRKGLAINPLMFLYSNLLLALNYATGYDTTTIFIEHQRFNEQYAKPLPVFAKRENHSPQRLKIGYVSADFYHHAVAYVFEPILAHHDHQQVEIFCYYNTLKTDEVTARLQQYADHWVSCANLSEEALADRIKADQIDILVDLSGHTAGHRLLVFAGKPAPVQVTFLGYPNTTGLKSIDYRITDSYVDPAGTADQFSAETLVRLPGSYFCYRPRDDSPPINELPVLHSGYLTFGSLNGYYKLNLDLFRLWARVLEAVPGAKLLVKTKSLNDPPTRQALLAQLAQLGVGPERLCLETFSPSPTHLTTYHRIDIALDSFPFTGGITTFEALWMGVPVVTLVGERQVARQGLSILSTLGLTELIAYTPEEYLDICIKLATDIKYLQQLRLEMRNRMQASPLMDGVTVARNLEVAYKKMWEEKIL